jgi:hypothetical protein
VGLLSDIRGPSKVTAVVSTQLIMVPSGHP